MTNPTLSKLGDLEITLSRAGRTCTVTGAELAKLVASPAIVIRLAAVLYSRSAPALGKEGCFNPEVERTACYLADRLDDSKSLAFYRRVAASVPAEVIRDALTRALDLRPANVRRSRAAYFTSLVRPYLQHRLPDS
jgi:hypothetical protein